MTVEENDKGTVLTVVEERDVVGSVTVAQLQLNDRLSPECGSHFRHCQDLLVLMKDESPGSRLLFVPLNKALGIVEVKKDEYTGSVGFSQTIVLRPSEVYCSPSAFFIITGAVFAVCTNRSTNSVYVLDIFLDKQDLNQTRYTYSNNINLSEGDLNNRTNFLQVNHLDYHFVIFGLGRAIYSIRPLFFIHSRLNDIPSDFCDILSWLSPKYGDEFWAYCSNNVIDYGIGVEDWKEAFTLEEKGISFWCSQQRINISVFSSYINVTRQDGQKHTISKMGQNFKSGVCTGNKDMSVFVYVDGVTGTHSLDLTSFETRSIFANSCEDSYSCRAPLVTDDKYLMVRGVPETVLVLDSTNISRKIVEAKGISAPMVTLLTFPCPPKPPSVPRDIGLQRSAPLSKMAKVLVGVAVSVVLVGVAVVTAVVVVCVRKQYKRYFFLYYQYKCVDMM